MRRKGVAKLPLCARPTASARLDDYLAHLEHMQARDRPAVVAARSAPASMSMSKRMPGAKREIATRAELMKRFGFSS